MRFGSVTIPKLRYSASTRFGRTLTDALVICKVDSYRYILSTSSTICSKTKSSQLILAMNEGFASIASAVEKAEYFKLLSKSATV